MKSFTILLLTLSIIFIPSSFAQSPYSGARFGKAVTLDGDGDFMEVPDASILNFGTDTGFTVELWFKKQRNVEMTLINKADPSRHGWQIKQGYYNQNPYCPIDCQLDPFCSCPGPRLESEAIRVAHGEKWWTYISNAIPFGSLNTWYHLAITVDRNLNETKIYADSESRAWRGKFEDHPPHGMDLSTPGSALGLGGLPNEMTSSDWFEGEIDEVRIWNRVRSESQIEATMSDTLGPEYYATPDSGLVLYYRFDRMEDLGVGGEGKDVKDYCALGHHGALKGDAITVGVAAADLPRDFQLLQNYPNPFNPFTTIRFSLWRPSQVTLAVYDLLGREIETLVRGWRPVGEYEVTWSAEGLTSGVYFYRLEAGESVETRKLILQK